MSHLRNAARSAGVFLGTIAVAGLLVSAATPKARADNHDKCRHAIEKADAQVGPGCP